MNNHPLDIFTHPQFIRRAVGFGNVFNDLNTFLSDVNKDSFNYPPHNIVDLGEGKYSIELAVAGFNKDSLDITVSESILTVSTKDQEDKEEHVYLHQGLAKRSFSRKFKLADNIEVTGADLKDGILTINLYKHVPEYMKPRTITIK